MVLPAQPEASAPTTSRYNIVFNCRKIFLLYNTVQVQWLYIYYIIYHWLSFKFTPRVFYIYFYNHAHRPRLEKLLYIGLYKSSNGYFRPLLDPGGGFASETAARRFQKLNGRYETVSEIYNGYKFITAICNGHSQRTKASVRV
jgi:hypothetical protein